MTQTQSPIFDGAFPLPPPARPLFCYCLTILGNLLCT
jgi:hypothetical protein